MARIYKTLFNMNLTSFFASLFLVLIPIENSFRNILALLLILTLTETFWLVSIGTATPNCQSFI